MTSVRPKLKPDTPKAVTAWETASGKTVYMTVDGKWSAEVSDIAAFMGDEADARLANAQTQEGIVTDPYFMEVTADGEITGRETLREKIRAEGPTVPYGDQT